MVYSIWLFGFSVLFLAAERLWPYRPQRLFRKGFVQDLFYLVFHSEYLGVALGILSSYTVTALDRALDSVQLKESLYLGLASGLPFWMQLLLLLVIFDFAQWLIHNLLHRVDWLWEFHKLHHSIEEMDWIGNWRFHWAEVVVYRSLLYIPAGLFGFSGPAMFCFGLLNTIFGHFAHANLRVRIGVLKYLVNSPEMHRWHHAHPDSGPINRNFGITLSVWDWIFGTAYLPDNTDPKHLGFAGIETYPKDLPGRMLAPFQRRHSTQETGRLAGAEPSRQA